MCPAWYVGRHPERSIIVATYNEHYSQDLGRKIRDIMMYAAVPAGVSRCGDQEQIAAAVNRVETTAGGVIFCVGRGSAITGRGAHSSCSTIRSRIAKRPTASRSATRCGQWYTQVLRTRLMNKTGTIVMIQTRWTEDDLVGRLIDPLNAYYSVR